LRGHIVAQPDMEIVGEAEDGMAAVSGVLRVRPDVAVLDVSMPVLDGAEATGRILRACPTVRVLALSGHEDTGYARQMPAAGATGYVTKRAAADDLVQAIRVVAGGGTFLDPNVAGPLIAGLIGQTPVDRDAPEALSKREAEVLRRIARGDPIKQ